MKSMKEIHTADCCHIQLWPHLIMVRSKGPGAITTDLCGLFMKQICSLSGPHLPHLIAIAKQHSILCGCRSIAGQCELHVILKDEPWETVRPVLLCLAKLPYLLGERFINVYKGFLQFHLPFSRRSAFNQ